MTNQQNPHVIFIDEPQDLTTYAYIKPYTLNILQGMKSLHYLVTKIQIKRSEIMSKCNQLLFREHPGVKSPPLDPRTILITRDEACEILLKTRKRVSPDVAHILKKFKIETTNKKCLTKEQMTLSDASNLFKTEVFKDQYKVGHYFLDLYFPENKIIVECDENGHSERDEEKRREWNM